MEGELETSKATGTFELGAQMPVAVCKYCYLTEMKTEYV